MSALRAAELDEALYGPTVASAAVGDALAFVAIVLRFLARRLDQQGLWYDDFLVIPSLMATLAASFTSWATFGNNRIPGNDPLILDGDMRARFLRVYYLYQAIGPLAHACYKLSILALILRVFKDNEVYRKTVFSSITLVVAWTIAFSLTSVFRCQPVAKLWRPLLPGTCLNPAPLIASVDFSNIGLGLWVFGLLAVQIMRSELLVLERKRKRWTITLVLGLLVIGIGCSMAYFDIFQLMPFFLNRTYSINGATMSYLLEINLGVICACVPILPPVFQLCCVPQSRKAKRNSTTMDRNIKALELEASEPCVELGDPENTVRDRTGRLCAELLDAKENRGELHGTMPLNELPSFEKCIEIDGREISRSVVTRLTPPHTSLDSQTRVPCRAVDNIQSFSSFGRSVSSRTYSSTRTFASTHTSLSPSQSVKEKELPALPRHSSNFLNCFANGNLQKESAG